MVAEVNAPVPVPYHGLKYDFASVNVRSLSHAAIRPSLTPSWLLQNLTISTLKPQSPPQVIGLAIDNNIHQGSLTLNPYISISAAPNVNKGAKTFDLIDFYFGCIVPTFQTTVNVAGACSISVTGIREDGSIAGEVPFSFAPTTLLGSNSMSRANVVAQALTGDYVNLKTVNITITDATLNAALGVLFVDNVRHINRC